MKQERATQAKIESKLHLQQNMRGKVIIHSVVYQLSTYIKTQRQTLRGFH